MKPPKKNKTIYSPKEELFNALTHGLGVFLGLVVLALLVGRAYKEGREMASLAFTIYGLGFVLLFLASTLYHSVKNPRTKARLRVFDHSSIFIFIAATYTPLSLLVLSGPSRWIILLSIWILAISGIIFKLFTSKKLDRFKHLSVFLYILMGWLAVFTIKPIVQTLGWGFFLWILAGGLLYSLGTIFYTKKTIPYHHGIWHLFVLAAAIAHFMGFFLYLS